MTPPFGRLRVLHVLEALEGGTARHVVDLVRHAPDVDHVAAIPYERVGWATDRQAADSIERAGGTVQLIDMRRRPIHARNAVALAALRRLLREVQPDVVHGHSSVGGALARLASIGGSVPVVYTPNGLARGRAARTIERVLARRTSRFVAVSPSEGDLALELGLTTRDRLVVIPNGINLEPPAYPTGHEMRAALGISRDAFVIGTVSRLVAQKAPEVFTRAARLAVEHEGDAHVVLIGSGPLSPQVRREGSELGDRFHLVEQLDDAADALNGLDVFVLASRFEGGPYTPLEAMRAGVPVVLTNVVGNRDTVVHERTGLLVPPDDPEALRAAILRCRHDPALRDRLVAGAREALPGFAVGRMGAATSRMYHGVVHGPPAGLSSKFEEPQ